MEMAILHPNAIIMQEIAHGPQLIYYFQLSFILRLGYFCVLGKLISRLEGSHNKKEVIGQDIALKTGASRARITRISNMGENSISIELLLKIIVALENKSLLKVA